MYLSRLKLHIILSLALAALAFCGMAAAEQLYVNESGWWREGGAFNVSTAPISAAVGAAAAGDLIYVGGGSYVENVDVNKTLTLVGEGADVVTVTAAEIIVGLYGESFDLAKIWDWNGTAWCNSHTLVGHTSYINSVSIGDVIDGGKNEVVSGSADDSVRIWIGPQSDATPQKGDLNDDGKITPTDAAIALQITVGSRPPDPHWDVSGDNRVTSLDALMILQSCGRCESSN